MAKLSDIFLNSLGGFLLGAGGVSPVAYRQQQEENRMKEQEFGLNKARTLADVYSRANIQPDEGGQLPQGASRVDLSSLGLGPSVMSQRESSFLPVAYDPSGNPVFSEPVSVPSGTKPIYGAKPTTKTASSQKAPTGFRYTTSGDLEAIPGGPAGLKLQDKEKKEAGLRDASIRQADLVINKIDQALQKVGFTTTGIGGAVLGGIPGTKAKNLKRDIDTIKANLGFSTLQEMRRNSPTGGALGQVAVQELEMLQSTISSLDPTQSDEQVIRNLNEIKTHYNNWKNAVQQAGQSVGDPEADAAIQKIMSSSLPELEKQNRITQIRSRIGQ